MFSIQGGIGDVFVLPVAGVGNPPSPSFPQRLLSLASLKIEAKAKHVNLMGSNQMPDDSLRSETDMTIDMEVGRVSLDLLNMTAGETIATGYVKPVIDEGPTAIPVSPFAITVVDGATLVDDLVVVDAATGQQFRPVASAPTAGQYIPPTASVGTYTFCAADNTSGRKVKISYTKTVAGSGRTLTIGNHPSGFGPVVRILANCPYTCPAASSPFGAINVRCAKIDFGLQFKRDGFLMVPIKGVIYPDGSGQAVDLWSPGAAS
jgi:hypothetical protein